MKNGLWIMAGLISLPILGQNQIAPKKNLIARYEFEKNERMLEKINYLKSKQQFAKNMLNEQYEPRAVKEEEVVTEVRPEETVVSEKKADKKFSSSYFLFVSGPGITQETHNYPPNALGRPDFTGINSFNVISFKYKLNDRYNLDFQTRTRFVFNNGVNTDDFNWFLWEAPRIGVSGKLLNGENWNITGAVNSDFPHFLPEPLTGYTARKREVLFNPGMFANYNYSDPNSKWSYDVLLTPRFFFYEDDNAIEPEALNAGFTGKNKPHLVISISPSVNYQVDDKLSWTVGTTLDYIKQVGSTWNVMDATMISNTREAKWVFDGMPIMVGPNYKFSKSLQVFSFVQFFPIEKQRESYTTGRRASFEDTISVGMWLRGSLF